MPQISMAVLPRKLILNPHFHSPGEQAYSKLDRMKTMGRRGKIKAI